MARSRNTTRFAVGPGPLGIKSTSQKSASISVAMNETPLASKNSTAT
jgi:hypothetical protein